MRCWKIGCRLIAERLTTAIDSLNPQPKADVAALGDRKNCMRRAFLLPFALTVVCCSPNALTGIAYKTAAQKGCLIANLQGARIPFEDRNDGMLWFPLEHAETVKGMFESVCSKAPYIRVLPKPDLS